MPAGNSRPGTETCLTDIGDSDAIAAHRPRDADALAQWEPSRPVRCTSGPSWCCAAGQDARECLEQALTLRQQMDDPCFVTSTRNALDDLDR
jgi:hypothetical protein